ncbi:hypothetical protein [Roseococcus sp. YIM B11640]|uniref:hypothetical protein n=1 Tax=Roseococcus sp. YIM B11640 TaxID=3133973 RepID=UPI003C7CB1C8
MEDGLRAMTEAMTEAVRAAIRAEIAPLHAFLDRRLAELSAELRAAIELADMTEERLAAEIGQIRDRIAVLVAAPALGARNSGVELEAVVMATEAAANRILEAAEAIQDWVREQKPGDAGAVAERVNAIFEACSFQDVTGQRVRRAIQHLHEAESALERFLPPAPGSGEPPRPAPVVIRTAMATVAAAPGSPDLGQEGIDALLAG